MTSTLKVESLINLKWIYYQKESWHDFICFQSGCRMRGEQLPKEPAGMPLTAI